MFFVFQNPFTHLARRMTRFNLTLSLEEGVKKFCNALDKESYKTISSNQVSNQAISQQYIICCSNFQRTAIVFKISSQSTKADPKVIEGCY